MTFGMQSLVQGLLLLLGAFYVFAGLVGIKVSLSGRFIDIAIAGIEGKPPLKSETARAAWLLVSALLVLAGGLALVLRLKWAAWAFLASAAGQAIYLLFVAPVLFDPNDPPDATGRQQTTNAFILYAAVTAFVLWAYRTGGLTPIEQAWTPGLAVAGLLLAAATLYAGKKFLFPFRGGGSGPGRAADARDEASGVEVPARPLHTAQGIVVMADYECHPLWARDPDLAGDIDPGELGLSETLVRDLAVWADAYTGSLNRDDPLSPLWSEAQYRAHWEAGLALARRLKRELPEREIFMFDTEKGHIEITAGDEHS